MVIYKDPLPLIGLDIVISTTEKQLVPLFLVALIVKLVPVNDISDAIIASLKISKIQVCEEKWLQKYEIIGKVPINNETKST